MPKNKKLLTVAAFVGIIALNAFAEDNENEIPPSSIQERTSYNSERQLSSTLGGIWGATKRTSLNLNLSYARTPLPDFGKRDTYYSAAAGLAYGVNTFAFDAGAHYSRSPLPQLTTYGGYIGFTMLYYKPVVGERDHTKRALTTLHKQTYDGGDDVPLFWLRVGYLGSKLKSTAIGSGARSGKEYALTADLTAPLRADIFLTLGVGLYGYEDRGDLFKAVGEPATTINAAMLGSTVQGLPRETYSLGLSLEITRLDAFMPKYQGTVILSNSKWAHTGIFGWRHTFFGSWNVTPNLEFTNVAAYTVSGFALEIQYLL